jgi:hypothetical protein
MLLSGCSTRSGPEASRARAEYASRDQATNSFAIYLIAERVDPASRVMRFIKSSIK